MDAKNHTLARTKPNHIYQTTNMKDNKLGTANPCDGRKSSVFYKDRTDENRDETDSKMRVAFGIYNEDKTSAEELLPFRRTQNLPALCESPFCTFGRF